MQLLPAGDPADVIETIVRLIDTPRGKRPTRTVVRPEGAEPLAGLNELQTRITRGVLDLYGDPAVLSNGV